jgi:exoribonuclease R
LWAIESRPVEAERELRSGTFLEDLNAVAMHCSLQAEVAEMAETAVDDLKICQYLEPHIDEKVEARILRVSRTGMEILLVAFHVTGFLPMRDLGERPVLAGPTLTVRSGKRSLSFTEGYPIAVRVKDVDFLRLQVMLQLA